MTDFLARLVARVEHASLPLLKSQAELIQIQTDLIAMLRNEVASTELQHTRISRDLIDQFLITLEQPELHDLAREGLLRARVEFSDQVARLEEMTA